MIITSTSNPQVKELLQLRKKAKARDAQDVFLVEGLKMFQEAPRERIRKVYVAESLYEQRGQALLAGLEPVILEDRVFAAVSDTRTPQGILCVMDQYHYVLEDLLGREAPFLLILEDLQDPGNVGTILRTAEGAGADGIILSRKSVDLYNPKTIRSTMGSIYRMPFLYVDRPAEILPLLKERRVRTCAAHLEGDMAYHQPDYRKPAGFLIGNEGNGLSRETAGMADTLIRIPMDGQVESLNAAVAAAVLMYEVRRQRDR